MKNAPVASTALAIIVVVLAASGCGPPPPKWRLTEIEADELRVAVEMPALTKPRVSGPWTGEAADLGKIRFIVMGVRDTGLAGVVRGGGHALAGVANDAIAHIGASWHTNLSAGDLRGAELKLGGQKATGTLRLLASGDDVVLVGCFAEGTFGIGREIARMRELCPRFYDSLAKP